MVCNGFAIVDFATLFSKTLILPQVGKINASDKSLAISTVVKSTYSIISHVSVLFMDNGMVNRYR